MTTMATMKRFLDSLLASGVKVEGYDRLNFSWVALASSEEHPYSSGTVTLRVPFAALMRACSHANLDFNSLSFSATSSAVVVYL